MATTPSTTPSVKVDKTFPFKGANRDFSNRYHFLGGTPPDAAHWKLLMDSVVSVEQTIFSADALIVKITGYAAGSELPVHEELYNTPGNLSPGAGVAKAPGEVAALVRYTTNARSIKNHPIYLFQYYHDIFVDTAAGGQDTLSPNQHATMLAYGQQWLNGFTDGVFTYKRASPHGAAAVSVAVETHVTHRDFPYTPSV
jgi:hypothetical protein